MNNDAATTARSASVEERVARIEELVALLATELHARRGESTRGGGRRGTDSRVLTLNQAARLLGVSRRRTLPGLIEDGLVRTVQVAGQTRVPMSEIERIEAEGTRPYAAAPRTPRARAGAPLVKDMLAEATKLKVA